MSEQTQKPSPDPETHQQIADKIQEAVEILPRSTVSIDEPYDGMTSIGSRGLPEGTWVLHDKADSDSPEEVIGKVEIEDVTRGVNTSGVYAFRSRKGTGVEDAVVMRDVEPRDTITRAGSTHYHREGRQMSPQASIYEHGFKPESRDKVGKLVTGLAIKQATRNTRPAERV